MRSRRAPAEGVSLSPFLAVLICTIGALTVLLMLMSRHARMEALKQAAKKQAEEVAAPATEASSSSSDSEDPESQPRAELAKQSPVYGPDPPPPGEVSVPAGLYAGVLNAKIEELQAKRDQVRQALREMRLHLSHVEDHLRTLKENVVQIKAAENKIAQLEKQQGLKKEQLAERIKTFQQTLADKQRGLQQARDEAKNQNAAFAIIPFEGRNQTRRQPIYLECRADGVVIQPFGIKLGEEDFSGPVGPSNPLASALRAMSEQIVLTRSADGNPQGTPYPLMIVRPDGIMYYYAARAALQEWESEFGYELIDSEMELAYPKTDPRLGSIAELAIKEARKRQQRVIVMAPGLPRGTGGSGRRYRLGADGNIVPDTDAREIPETIRPRVGSPRRGGNSASQQGPERYQSLGSDSRLRGKEGTSGRFGGEGLKPYPSAGNRNEPSLRTGNDVPFSSAQRPGRGGNSSGNGSGPQGNPDNLSLPRSNQPGFESQRRGSRYEDLGSSTAAAASQMSQNQTNRSAANAGGSSSGNPNAPSSNQRGPSSGNRNLGAVGSPGEGNLSIGQPRTQEGSSSGSGSSRTRSPAPAGKWAAAPASPGSIGVRKSVRVVVHHHYLQVLPGGEPIPFQQVNREVANQLVADVYAEVQQWGVAGQGMHWRPVVQAEVGQGAEAQFSRLEKLLRSSGLSVEQAKSRPRISRLPPIE